MWVDIQTSLGTQRVRAKRLGPLAIHGTWNNLSGPSRTAFTITHIATGHAVYQGTDRKTALLFARRLQGLDWNFKRPSSGRRVASAVRKIFDSICEEYREKRVPA